VTVFEFSDLECPACAEFHKVLVTSILPKYGDQVHFVVKDFPLPYHLWAEPAAISSRCVAQIAPESYPRYRDLIFEHQAEISIDNARQKLLDLGSTVGVDREQLTSCIDEGHVESAIQRNVAEGRQLEIGILPTIYIEGYPLSGDISAEKFDSVIAKARLNARLVGPNLSDSR